MLRYAFDWEWFLRASKVCRFTATDALLSRYRIHKAHKTGTGGKKRWIELLSVVRRHSSAVVISHYEFLMERILRALVVEQADAHISCSQRSLARICR